MWPYQITFTGASDQDRNILGGGKALLSLPQCFCGEKPIQYDPTSVKQIMMIGPELVLYRVICEDTH